MNLVQMICCVLIAKASEFGQTYLSDKVGTLRVRRVQTIDDATKLIDSAAQELKIASSDLCKCDAVPTPAGRRMSWQNRENKLDGQENN